MWLDSAPCFLFGSTILSLKVVSKQSLQQLFLYSLEVLSDVKLGWSLMNMLRWEIFIAWYVVLATKSRCHEFGHDIIHQAVYNPLLNTPTF